MLILPIVGGEVKGGGSGGKATMRGREKGVGGYLGWCDVGGDAHPSRQAAGYLLAQRWWP